MKKLTDRQINEEIYKIVCEARPGDIGMARTMTFFGFSIRVMTSRGLHRAWSNHNFPIWEDANSGVLVTLQIGPPVARVVTLREYLEDVYEAGGRVLIARPDQFDNVMPSPAQMKSLTECWLEMVGTKYDKKGIRQILKMYLKIGKNTTENGKENVYCTEGTIAPYLELPVLWVPDLFVGEKYPVPIHFERLIRQSRLVFGAGSRDVWDMILNKY